ncbi:Spermatogenesis-associated protein 1, partial [Galemys pyrenaicus]
KDKKVHKIPADNCPVLTLVNMYPNPSRPSSREVKTKQESELKLKSFVPPYALQPELYLLPIMDHLGNVFSSSSTDSLNGPQINNGVAEADGKIHIPVSVTLSKEEPGTNPSFLENALKEILNKNQEAGRKTMPKEKHTTKNQRRNSEFPGSSGDSNSNHFSNKSYFLWKNEDDRVNVTRRQENQMGKKEYITLPGLEISLLPRQPVLSPGINSISLLQIEREKIIEQTKQVKEERRDLEKIREDLIKKIEKLFQQNKLKRHHGFGGWKKKYLETKKVTASLDESLKKLREDLELYYKKLLMQLEAREIRMRPKNLANITDSKNFLIIQITEVQHAIDQLKRKLDTDKMKLIIEVKVIFISSNEIITFIMK